MRWMAALLLALLAVPALGRDNGQYGDVPANIRSWFNGVRNGTGIPCCSIADGHETDTDIRGGQYWVKIEGHDVPVPNEVIIRNYGNPMDKAIVWYYINKTDDTLTINIRCFVPTSEV